MVTIHEFSKWFFTYSLTTHWSALLHTMDAKLRSFLHRPLLIMPASTLNQINAHPYNNSSLRSEINNRNTASTSFPRPRSISMPHAAIQKPHKYKSTQRPAAASITQSAVRKKYRHSRAPRMKKKPQKVSSRPKIESRNDARAARRKSRESSRPIVAPGQIKSRPQTKAADKSRRVNKSSRPAIIKRPSF